MLLDTYAAVSETCLKKYRTSQYIACPRNGSIIAELLLPKRDNSHSNINYDEIELTASTTINIEEAFEKRSIDLHSDATNQKHYKPFVINPHGWKSRLVSFNKRHFDKKLIIEAFPSLVISMIGLVCAGWLLDAIQNWQIVNTIPELFILVPCVLNLKGNLEMTLASRFSTAANLGYLDDPAIRYSQFKGNLLILQIQSIIVGTFAGVFTWFLGGITATEFGGWSSLFLLTATALLCATIGSLILGVLMCAIVMISRKYSINPDNVAAPVAASIGDLITLAIFAASCYMLSLYLNTMLSFLIITTFLGCLPFLFMAVKKNKQVIHLLYEWNPWCAIFIALTIASFSGLVLEKFIHRYHGLALLMPVLCGIAGNLAAVYANRLTTGLHSRNTKEGQGTIASLMLINAPIQSVFLLAATMFHIGSTTVTFNYAITYLCVATILVLTLLVLTKWFTMKLWNWKLDPDNHIVPYMTAIGDVIGTGLMVFVYEYIL